MKKSLVLTSILFSSMALGSVIVTPGTVQAVADVSVNDKEVKNILEFYDENGDSIGEMQIVKGVEGEEKDISSWYIPYGYKLKNDKEKKIILGKDGEIRKITVVKSLFSNEVHFKNIFGRDVRTFDKMGEVGEVVDLDKEVPRGYRIKVEDSRLEITSDEKSIKTIVLESEEIKQKIIFNNWFTSEKVGESFDAEGLMGKEINTKDKIPLGYELLDENVYIDSNREQVVNVKPKYYSNKIKFITDDKEEFYKEIHGQFGSTENISDYVPNGYMLKKDQSNTITINSNEKDERTFQIERDKSDEYFENKVIFIDDKNEIVDTRTISGKPGKIITLDLDKLPTGYETNDKLQFVIKDQDDFEHKINVVGKKIEVTVKIVDYREYKELGEFTFTGKMGDKVLIPKEKIPKGYSEYRDFNLPSFVYEDGYFTISLKKKVQTQVNFLNADGVNIKTTYLNGLEGDNVTLSAPNGYKFINDFKTISHDSLITERNILVVPDRTSNSKPDKTKLKTIVTFIDKDTKKLVSNTSVTGKQGTKQTVQVPKGYKLAPGFSNVVNMDKNTGSVTIQLVKVNSSISVNKPGTGNGNSGSSTNKPGTSNNSSNPSSNKPSTNHNNSELNTSSKGKIEAYPANVATHFSSIAPLHDDKGREVRNRALMENSNWHVDKKMTLNGKTFYRVATHEWVSAEHVYEYVVNKTTITTKIGNYKHLYNSKGQMNKGRALANNTSWATDKTAVINGVKMHRVATDEWVAASDLK
ncbi:MSCRAMM family protein [Companilactobacillus sp. HBUAS59699]|uniref:MSCRAMM family protein n=1 Tax=Companilactobacillus sp. HBUAS59699 TaxID=3109358 RepID=UPI002FEE7258